MKAPGNCSPVTIPLCDVREALEESAAWNWLERFDLDELEGMIFEMRWAMRRESEASSAGQEVRDFGFEVSDRCSLSILVLYHQPESQVSFHTCCAGTECVVVAVENVAFARMGKRSACMMEENGREQAT